MKVHHIMTGTRVFVHIYITAFCSLMHGCHRFGRPYCLHAVGRRYHTCGYVLVKCYSIITMENTTMNVHLTCTAASVGAMKVWPCLCHRLLRTNVPITSHGYGDITDWCTSPRAPRLHCYILFYNATATTITPYSTHRLACSSLLRLGILWYYCDGRIILEWKHIANFCHIGCPIYCSDIALWKDG
jgi:hypothetical protein